MGVHAPKNVVSKQALSAQAKRAAAARRKRKG
jgi:hypothetical protein